MCCENKNNLSSLYKSVYPPVAKEFGCNPQCIERNIRTFLCNINYSKLSAVLNTDISSHLTVKDFIFLIVSHIDKKFLHIINDRYNQIKNGYSERSNRFLGAGMSIHNRFNKKSSSQIRYDYSIWCG